jgi:TolB protein
MNPDGTGQVNLTNSAGNDDQPAWSPDGTKLAFRSDRDGNSEIYVMNSDGSDAIRLTNDPADDGSPAWRPLR